MPKADGVIANGTRVIALVGPAGAGKTSVAEAMLFAAGATDRRGSPANGTSIGDCSPEARSRGGSTELNLYNFDYLGDRFALVDCPGSIGFAGRTLSGFDMVFASADERPPKFQALDDGAEVVLLRLPVKEQAYVGHGWTHAQASATAAPRSW